MGTLTVENFEKLKKQRDELLEALKMCLPTACQATYPTSPNYKDGAPCGKCAYCKAMKAIKNAESQ